MPTGLDNTGDKHEFPPPPLHRRPDRATGDARYPVVAGAASMLVVLAGGSWFLGVHLGLGLVGLWIAYTADEWIRGLLMWRRWATQGWVPHARATHRRLRALAVVPTTA